MCCKRSWRHFVGIPSCSAMRWRLSIFIVFVERVVANDKPPVTAPTVAATVAPVPPPPTLPVCSGEGATSVSVVSRQNASGHWLGDAWVERPAPPGRPLGPLKVHVSHERRRCGDAATLVLRLKLEGPPDPVRNDYHLFKGFGYYKPHTEKMSWLDAKSVCEYEGAHLVILNSQREAEIIMRMVANLGGIIFIGVSDMLTEGHFVTVFGEPLEKTGYVKWRATEPNGGRVESCVNLFENGEMNDISCESLLCFVCEYPSP